MQILREGSLIDSHHKIGSTQVDSMVKLRDPIAVKSN